MKPFYAVLENDQIHFFDSEWRLLMTSEYVGNEDAKKAFSLLYYVNKVMKGEA